FLPIAESDPATIDALTEWVFDATTSAWLTLASQGVRVPIAANVSGRNLHDRSLPDRLAERLHRAGMPAEMLCLEITESAAFDDTARIMDILGRLRLKGMQLAIDDFGTGYSSLKMLRQMPFCAIKIDQSFVTDLTSSRDSRAIVKSIIDLASNMEMESIAEGVDSEPVAALLEQMNAGSLQGHLIARSMPVAAVAGWLESWRETEPSVGCAA
ncbi:MAG TPA: EAL domain-containing protein, partial [Tepidisphaeraceae bacterium]|nr:EAL domain-containing protein [Tepidisphaeraceae bacterium]